MADKVAQEFNNIPRVTRDEAHYTRAWHRALKLLRELQKGKIRNEPRKDLTPIISLIKSGSSSPVEPLGEARYRRDALPKVPPTPIAPPPRGTSPGDGLP